MDLLVSVETKTAQVGERHKRIFDEFWERGLFPLIKIVRLVEGDEEIIDVYAVLVKKDEDGNYCLVTRQIEVSRAREYKRAALLPVGP